MSRQNKGTLPNPRRSALDENLENFVVSDNCVIYSSDASIERDPDVGRDSSDDESYRVEKILKHKQTDNGVLYFLKWEGYDLSEATWEDESSLSCPDLLKAYWDDQALRVKRRKALLAPENESGNKVAEKKKDPLRATGHKSKDVKVRRKKPNFVAFQPISVLLHTDYPPPELEDWTSSVKKVNRIVKNENLPWAIIEWDIGYNTWHPIEEIAKRCPQQLIKYYEENLFYSS